MNLGGFIASSHNPIRQETTALPVNKPRLRSGANVMQTQASPISEDEVFDVGIKMGQVLE